MRVPTMTHLFLALLAADSSYGIPDQYTPDGSEKKQMQKRNSGLPLHNFFQQRLRGQNMARLLNHSMWSQYAPNTPAPDEVECEFTIEVPQLVGGRCVRLGGIQGMAVCQSGVHLDFTRNDCERILSDRAAGLGDQHQGVRPHNIGQQQDARPRNIGQHRLQKRSVDEGSMYSGEMEEEVSDPR